MIIYIIESLEWYQIVNFLVNLVNLSDFEKSTKMIHFVCLIYLIINKLLSIIRAGGRSKKLVWQMLCIAWELSKTGGAPYSF